MFSAPRVVVVVIVSFEEVGSRGLDHLALARNVALWTGHCSRANYAQPRTVTRVAPSVGSRRHQPQLQVPLVASPRNHHTCSERSPDRVRTAWSRRSEPPAWNLA